MLRPGRRGRGRARPDDDPRAAEAGGGPDAAERHPVVERVPVEEWIPGPDPVDVRAHTPSHEEVLRRIEREAERRQDRLVGRGLIYRLDARAGDLVRVITRRGPGVDLWVRATTDLGSLFVVAPAAAELWRRGRRRQGAEVLAAGVLAWVVGQKAKRTFNRGRPYEVEGVERLIPPPTGSSLPSGHACVAAAVSTVVAARSGRGRRWPWVLVACYVPVTRVHLGVHYPGDTLVGAGLGWVLAMAVRRASDELAGA